MRKARGRYHHGDLAQAALAAAAKEINARGHETFTLEGVARRLGVRTSALYRHYQNREALLRAAMWQTFLRFADEVDRAVLAQREPRAVLQALASTYFRFAQENPGWFRFQFSRSGIALGLKHQEAKPRYPEAVFAALARLLGDDRRLLETWYLALWSLAHGVASLTIERVFPHLATEAEREAEARRIIDTVIAQLPARARGSPAPVPGGLHATAGRSSRRGRSSRG